MCTLENIYVAEKHKKIGIKEWFFLIYDEHKFANMLYPLYPCV